jgi:DNA-binding CsgD family transcriptional regulator
MGPASLTARELEVARLAALRLTAAEIAHELFISRRTVEGHLANVYAKLGVHSKREFSQRASTLGLVDRPRRP